MKWLHITAEGKEHKVTFDDFKDDSAFSEVLKIIVPTNEYSKAELFKILELSHTRLTHGGQIILCKTPNSNVESRYHERLTPFEKYVRTKQEWDNAEITNPLLIRLLKLNGFLRLFESEEFLIGQKDADPSSTFLPLVTIAIPAYKGDFFEHALLSAMGQSYPAKVVLVVDEGVDPRIHEICSQMMNQFPQIKVRYLRHERPLGEVANFEFCRSQAQGKYLKYLNDDDILDPTCVERFVRYMEAFDDSVTLIASRRNVVTDENVELLEPPFKPFEPLFLEDVYTYGRDIIEYCLNMNMNQLGEPTVVMFKIEDTDLELTKINDPEFPCSYDMVLNFKLLLKGNLIYLSDALSLFRIHSNQASTELKASLHGYCVWTNMILAMKKRGCFQDPGLYKMALERALSMLQDAKRKFELPEEVEKITTALRPLESELSRLEAVESKPKVIQNAFSLVI